MSFPSCDGNSPGGDVQDNRKDCQVAVLQPKHPSKEARSNGFFEGNKQNSTEEMVFTEEGVQNIIRL